MSIEEIFGTAIVGLIIVSVMIFWDDGDHGED